MFRFMKSISAVVLIILSLQARAQNVTKPNVKSPNGFEVNSFTGNLFHSRSDLKVAVLPLPVDITFYYNQSRRSKDWGMGKGWTFTYNMAYATDTFGIIIERADGKRDLFKKIGNTYTSPTGVFDVLTEYQTGKFKLTSKDGMNWFFDDAVYKRLSKIQDRNNNIMSFTYTDSLLTQIKDMSQHTYTLTWANGSLSKITDDCTTPVREVKYEYDTEHNPIKVTNPLGDFVSYYYSNNRMVGYGDERGFKMSMTYTASNAISKIISCLTTQTFSYVAAQHKTFVTELVSGQKQITTYTFDTTGRVIHKQGNCCGYNVNYEYTANNDIASVTNGHSQKTKYEYDSKGNVTKETDALGNSVAYTYNADNKVASMTDKRGFTTTYDYDANGNRTQIHKPNNITEKYRYYSSGSIASYTGGNGDTTNYQYNSDGFLTTVTDAYGKQTHYTYDCHGNRTGEIDARQNPTYYEYNLLNQLVKMTDAYGNETKYHYDKAGNLETVTNPLQKTITYEYDGLNRRIKTTTHEGVTTRTEYDEQNNVSKTTDGDGNATSYTYNSRRQPLSETDALGNSTTYDYDDAGNRTLMRDKRGNIIRYEYDELNRLKKQVNAMGGAISYSYDASGNRITEMDANGNVTAYEYDSLNRLRKIIDPYQKTIVYTYDGNNNRISEKDKNGNYTSYAYDSLNRMMRITDAKGGIRKIAYDENGNVLTEADQLNHPTRYTYDKLNRRDSASNAMDETTIYAYDSAGNNIIVTQPNGNIIHNIYDGDNRLTDVYDAIDSVAHYAYDGNNNVTLQRDGNSNPTRYEFDALNRKVKRFDAFNHFTRYEYDANGNLLKETDRNGYPKSYVYDALNRRVSETDALQHTTRFTYDANGNLLSIVDAKGNPTSYNYDALNRLLKEIYANGTTREFTYDPNGNRKTRKDGNGVITNYTYDVMNRMLTRSYPDNTADMYTYDSVGRRLTANNQNATIDFAYDNTNRILSETLNTKPTKYSYDIPNRKKILTYPSNRMITETRDKRDRLIAITEGVDTIASFDYNASDRLVKKKFGNGFFESYYYNANKWIDTLKCEPGNVLNFHYTYDNEGNKLTTWNGHQLMNSEKYTYDSIYQLTGFYNGKLVGNILVDTFIKSAYNYDALNNRNWSVEGNLVRKYFSNNMNAYDSAKNNGVTEHYTYDGEGNTLKENSNVFSYDLENRVEKQLSGNAFRIAYDALGRTIRKSGSDTTSFYFAGFDIIEERNSNDLVNKTVINGIWIDDICSYKLGTKNYFIINDLKNSIYGVADNNHVVERYTYGPFGQLYIYDSSYNPISISLVGNNFSYTGRNDFSQYLFNYRTRFYSSFSGRFLQRDLLKYPDGMNMYSYVRNNPVNSIDPFGTFLFLIPVIIEGTLEAEEIYIFAKSLWDAYRIWRLLSTIQQTINLKDFKSFQDSDDGDILGRGVIGTTLSGSRIWVQGKCKNLRDEYKKSCNEKRRCTQNDTPEQIKTKLNNGKKCYYDRRDYMLSGCDKDVDEFEDHIRQLNEARNAVINCNNKLPPCDRLPLD